MCMCECVGVGECAELWFWAQEEREKTEMTEKKERGGRKMGIKWGRYIAVQPKDRERKNKFCCWWTVRDRSIFPTAWLSAQSQSIQYKSVRRSILVYNNMVSSWRSYRWQALINTCLWSGRTLNTRLVVQCYLVVTLMANFKCHVPARLQIGHHGWGVTGEARVSWDR